MNGPLLKTPAAQPVVAATLAGHPRAAAGVASAAAVREAVALRAADTPAADTVQAAQQRAAEEIDALRRAAQDEGLRQGRLDAQRQIEETMKRHDAALQSMVAGLESAVRERLDGLEEFALAIAYEACGTVLSHAAVDGGAVADSVRRLVQPLRQPGGVQVLLHPDDVARVAHALRDDPRHATQALRFEPDDSLARGDCRIVTSHGQIESGLAIQLAAIRDSLLATHAALKSNKDAAP